MPDQDDAHDAFWEREDDAYDAYWERELRRRADSPDANYDDVSDDVLVRHLRRSALRMQSAVDQESAKQQNVQIITGRLDVDAVINKLLDVFGPLPEPIIVAALAYKFGIYPSEGFPAFINGYRDLMPQLVARGFPLGKVFERLLRSQVFGWKDA
jgi:hypothetical protein